MGSCISKCSPKPKKCYLDDEDEEETEHTQDKIVISQITKTPIPVSNKVSPFPPSPTSSSCFSSATGTSTACTSASSCSSSSVLTSKDRSFSNEFLWACVKENPHIIRINSIKEAALALATSKIHAPKMEAPNEPVNSTRKEKGFTPKKKRGRSNSPAPLPRQKSFRKSELETINTLPERTLKSPSLSRRFNGESGWGISSNTMKANGSKRFQNSKVSPIHSISPSPSGRFNGDSGWGISSNTLKASGSKRFHNSKVSPIHSISPSPSGRFNGDSGWGISSNTLRASGSKRFHSSKVSPIHSISASPSGRFSGESGWGILSNTSKAYGSKRFHGSKVSPINPVCENSRAENASSGSGGRLRSCMRNRETCIHRISSKIDEIAAAAALTEQDGDVVMEDFDNPLISLDCFIFL